MKRSFAEYSRASTAQVGTRAKVPSTGNGYAVKFLFSEPEMRAIVRHGAEIQELSGATLSTTGELYPATAFQELNISGPDAEVVLSSAIYTLTRIVQVEGALTNGEGSVPDGECRLRTVVPTKAAAGIIGKGGANITQMRATTQLHVHVDKTALPPDGGLLSEQIVSLSGPLAGLQTGLAMVLDHVHNMVGEHWFAAWALSSNVGLHFEGVALDLSGKGMRGGKGGELANNSLSGKGPGLAVSGEVCKFFARSGWCKFGEACWHVHSGGVAQHGVSAAAQPSSGTGFSPAFSPFDESRGGTDPTQAILQALGLGSVSESNGSAASRAYPAAVAASARKTICRFFALGQCAFGENCRNLHVDGAVPNKPESRELCIFFQKSGWCKWGDGCHHIHVGGPNARGAPGEGYR